MTDCAEDDNGCCRHHRDEITGLRVSLNLAQAQKACLKAERNNAQADLVEVKSQADILIKNLQGQLNSLRPELRKVKEELRAMRNEDTLLKEEIKLVVGYSAELNQQLETLKPKASEATE
jgi:predicted nuclease with TOPRIM domain